MNRFIKKAVAIMLLTSIVTASGGCSKQNKETAYRIAVILKSTDSYWDSVWTACDHAEEEESSLEIVRLSPDEEDPEAQITYIEEAVSLKVDAIVLAPINSEVENDAIQAAADTGIPILTIDTESYCEDVITHLGTVNSSAAAIVAERAADLLDGEGKIGIIYHGDSTTAIERVDVFVNKFGGTSSSNALPAGSGTKQNGSEQTEGTEDESVSQADTTSSESTSNVKILTPVNGEGNIEVSKEQTKKLITEEHVDLIYATNQPGTIGACEAISELIADGTIQQGEVMLVGIDFFDGAYEYITSGVMNGVLVQNPYNMGYLGIRNAMAVIDGENVRSSVDTGVTWVTIDNLDDEDVQFVIDPTA